MRNHYHKLKQNIALKKSKKKDEDDHKNLHLNTAGMNSSLFTFQIESENFNKSYQLNYRPMREQKHKKRSESECKNNKLQFPNRNYILKSYLQIYSKHQRQIKHHHNESINQFIPYFYQELKEKNKNEFSFLKKFISKKKSKNIINCIEQLRCKEQNQFKSGLFLSTTKATILQNSSLCKLRLVSPNNESCNDMARYTNKLIQKDHRLMTFTNFISLLEKERTQREKSTCQFAKKDKINQTYIKIEKGFQNRKPYESYRYLNQGSKQSKFLLPSYMSKSLIPKENPQNDLLIKIKSIKNIEQVKSFNKKGQVQNYSHNLTGEIVVKKSKQKQLVSKKPRNYFASHQITPWQQSATDEEII